MKISIITVCFNSEQTIKNTLESLFLQSYNNIEYILIDGASTDNTMKIVSGYKDKFNYIISESDKGMYDALNKGIKLSSGDIIGILNSDDEFNDNNLLEIISDRFKMNNKLDAIIGDVAFINKNKKVVRYYSASKWNPFLFKFGYMPPHPSFYCKRNLFKEYGYYNTDFKIAGDFELLLRFIYVYNINYEYIKYTFVNMKLGGLSTSGLDSLIQINKEILYAFKINNLKTNYFYLYSRYLKKSFQYLFQWD